MSFDHLSAGTAESVWAGDRSTREIAPLPLPAGGRLVVLAAHPDDETLAAGGLIATVVAAGGSVDVILATAGEHSHPRSTTWSAAELARARRDELEQALRHLGGTNTLTWLGFSDGTLADQRADLRAAVAEAVTDRPVPLLAAPWRYDGHPDHDALGAVAAEIVRDRPTTLLEYPIWFWHWATPAEPSLPWSAVRCLDLTPEAYRAKAAALAAHVTQTQPLSPAPGDEAILPPGLQAHFERTYELFIVSGPTD